MKGMTIEEARKIVELDEQKEKLTSAQKYDFYTWDTLVKIAKSFMEGYYAGRAPESSQNKSIPE